MDAFENYLKNFNYHSIGEMKISPKKLLEHLVNDDVQVIDVRFKEEYGLWKLSMAKHIPLNELPERLGELDREKLIVVVCPHNTRSNIAMHFLMTKGFKAKFLVNGLIDMQEMLVGGTARDFYNIFEKEKEHVRD